MSTLKNPSVGILEVGFGNLPSLQRIFKQLDVRVDAVLEPDQLSSFDYVVVPGVGAFDSAMNFLNNGGFVNPLRYRCLELQKPTLGICLGGQILLAEGFENKPTPGVGIFGGEVVKYSNCLSASSSHNGWDVVQMTQSMLNLQAGDSFDAYFNHDYIFNNVDLEDICAVSEYGGTFPVILKKYKTLAIQFHPEKSQSAGINIINEFLRTSGV